MPTSKDILTQAKKDLDSNTSATMALDDALTLGQKDIADLEKAKAVLKTSINSMSGLVKVLEEELKELAKGLTELKKNEPVMKAPADAKVYAALVDAYTKTIRSSMEYHKKLEEKVKDAKGRL